MSVRKLWALVALLIAVTGALGAASAAAAEFTHSELGPITGVGITTQVFETGAAAVKCAKAEASGVAGSFASADEHFTLGYSACKAFGGLVNAEVSATTYTVTANGIVHIKKRTSIRIPGAGCEITIPEQSVGSVSFDNGTGLTDTYSLTGITYTSSGGLCGSSGTSGTYTGSIETKMAGGGSISFDP
jgi:hypothetical protein